MKKLLLSTLVAGSLAMGFIGTVAAAPPAKPGCFGTDRAAYAQANGSLGNDAGGVGYYASLRAGDNGAINQAYKTICGGDPA